MPNRWAANNEVDRLLDELTGLADVIQNATVTPICCGNRTEDHGYVCCGQPDPDWPEWAVEAMSKAVSVRDRLRAYLADPGYRRAPEGWRIERLATDMVRVYRPDGTNVPAEYSSGDACEVMLFQLCDAMLTASQGEGE